MKKETELIIRLQGYVNHARCNYDDFCKYDLNERGQNEIWKAHKKSIDKLLYDAEMIMNEYLNKCSDVVKGVNGLYYTKEVAKKVIKITGNTKLFKGM